MVSVWSPDPPAWFAAFASSPEALPPPPLPQPPQLHVDAFSHPTIPNPPSVRHHPGRTGEADPRGKDEFRAIQARLSALKGSMMSEFGGMLSEIGMSSHGVVVVVVNLKNIYIILNLRFCRIKCRSLPNRNHCVHC